MTTTQLSYSPLRTILFVCLCVLTLQGSGVEAKSVSYSPAYVTIADGECRDWTIDYSILYKANIYNDSLGGILLNDGDALPVGTQIRFQDGPYVNTDISWFLTGFSADSPFGAWVSQAGNPPASSYTDIPYYSSGWYNFSLALSVDPPLNVKANHSGTAGLSCNASGMICTVTSPGSIISNIIFTNRPYQWVDATGAEDCTSFSTGLENNINLFDSVYGKIPVSEQRDLIEVGWMGNGMPQVTAPSGIPSQTIPFSLTAVTSNNPPTAPTIVGPTTGEPSTSYSFSLTATDPDNDTIRYGLDWNNDTLVDQWVPSSGYINSGTSQSVNKLWPAVGTYTFKALTEDVNSGRSGWTSHTITIANLCAIGIINNCGVMETPSGGNSGTCTVSGTCNYTCTNGAWSQNNNSCVVPKCSDGIDNDSPLDGFIDYGSGPLNDPGCSSSIDTDEYNALTPPELTTTARVVDPGPSGVPIDLIWDTNNGNEALCSLTGGLIATNPLDPANTNIPIGNVDTGSTTVTISARTTYTLTCPNGTDTTMVEVVPRGTET